MGGRWEEEGGGGEEEQRRRGGGGRGEEGRRVDVGWEDTHEETNTEENFRTRIMQPFPWTDFDFVTA